MPIASSKFDYRLNEEWGSSQAEIETPKFADILAFLTKKAKIVEAVNDTKQKGPFNKERFRNTFVSCSKINCEFCNDEHVMRNS